MFTSTVYRQLTLLRRFRWICRQYKSLRQYYPSSSIRGALGRLPSPLYEIYEQTLRGIDKRIQDFVHRLFQCLVVLKRPLYVEDLAIIFAIPLDAGMIPTILEPAFQMYLDTSRRLSEPKESVLSACSLLVTVVNVDGKEVVRFSRSSAREYLTSDHIASSDVSQFWVHPMPAHALLAGVCLSLLIQIGDDIDRVGNLPLALYAAQYWVDHARFANVSSGIQHAIRRLFDRNKPHFATWLSLYDIDNPLPFFVSSVYTTRPYPVLYYAALCGLRDIAEHLVGVHPQDLNARGGTRGTPLHAALDGGHQSVAMLLMWRGADIISLDSQSRTPLHIACRGCTNVVSVLIDRGVDLNAEDDSRETPLHVASQHGRDDITQLLLDHYADPDRRDDGGWTPLHVASHEGHDKIVRLLFDRGADANCPDNGGWTPLHLASWEGHEDVVRLLLDLGINANHPDNGGWTPLHVALQEGHNYIVELLLDHGADPNHSNNDGSTSLHVALQRNHDHTVRLLLDHGANPNYPKSDGETSLHLASQRGHDNNVRLLLNHGADANYLNGDGWAPLHLASQRGHYDVVKSLLKHGAYSNRAHTNGLTPLHIASQEGHDHIVRLLLDHGVEANRLNSDGWTPLHLASQRGHDHIVQLLVEHGVDADQPNSDSLTPMGFVSREGGVERKPPKGFAIATRNRRRV